ncbi:JAB domain-containing protein [Desulfonatronovibrio magnus]|uniref:JAB domain-containing protein n=1 Tax=Desulfonatronovibrio magnus TaxID=698827 RepID=UPI0009FCCE95|nr:DNA repair protein RadC [Desulfonatronovibrio magnus]
MQDKIKSLLNELYAMEAKPDYYLSNPEASVVALLPYRKKKTEHFVALYVDNKNRLICKKVMSKGTVDQAPVFPREIVRHALLKQASGLILGHNHPGGDPEPSLQDRELTSKIKRICQELGIRVLDHVIVTDTGHFSFQEHGYL